MSMTFLRLELIYSFFIKVDHPKQARFVSLKQEIYLNTRNSFGNI